MIFHFIVLVKIDKFCDCFSFSFVYLELNDSFCFPAEAPVHHVGYQSLVGSNEFSWGWDLGRNKAYHDSKNKQGSTYPANLRHDETFVVPDKFLGENPFTLKPLTIILQFLGGL